MRTSKDEQYIYNAKDADSTGVAISCEDFRYILLTLSSADTANFTIKFQGSMSDDCPDFSAARTVLNRWEYIQVKDMQSGSAIDGDTGVSFAAADDVLRYETVFSGYNWVSATISSYVAGSITLSVKLYNNK